MLRHTYSLNASLLANIFKGPIIFKLRWDQSRYTPVFNDKLQQVKICLLNQDVFDIEMQNFIQQHSYINDQGQRRCRFPLGKGIQFDTNVSKKYLGMFHSHTYIPGTIREGGYTNYSLK